MNELASGRVTVRVPATSANLGPGFDGLALALDLADVVSADPTPSGTEVLISGEGAGELPTDDSHLVVATLRGAFDAWGVRQPGLQISCTNAIPQGRGLGSSAAAIVAGLRLAEELLPDQVLDQQERLAVAAALEGHPDNVAGCLLGGLVVVWTEAGLTSAASLPVDSRVLPVVVCADRVMPTSVARGLLPPEVRHADAAANSGRAALLVAALTGRPDLLVPATADLLHQEARRTAYPDTMRLVDQLREREIPAVVSGAGPSVLALCRSEEEQALVEQLSPRGWRPLRLHIDGQGASVTTARRE
jgi:homoserine kinase